MKYEKDFTINISPVFGLQTFKCNFFTLCRVMSWKIMKPITVQVAEMN